MKKSKQKKFKSKNKNKKVKNLKDPFTFNILWHAFALFHSLKFFMIFFFLIFFCGFVLSKTLQLMLHKMLNDYLRVPLIHLYDLKKTKTGVCHTFSLSFIHDKKCDPKGIPLHFFY